MLGSPRPAGIRHISGRPEHPTEDHKRIAIDRFTSVRMGARWLNAKKKNEYEAAEVGRGVREAGQEE